jgi:glycosyltransferase involved in cell wall biosynthesis
MRILVLSNQVPRFPGPGGESRCFCYLRELSAGHSFTLLTNEVNYPGEAERLRRMGIGVETVTPEDPQDEPAGECVFKDFSRLPWAAREVGIWRGMMRKKIRDHIARGIDLIQVEHSTNGIWLDGLGASVPRILVCYDIRSLLEYRFFKTGASLRQKPAALLEWLRMRSYERRVTALFNRIVVLSESERRKMGSLTGRTDIAIVPNGVDTRFFSPLEGASDPEALVFTGSMFWPPNYDAMRHCITEILPRIWRERPGVTLSIVGPRAPEFLRRLSASDRRITLHDYTGDQRPCIARAAAYIVPIRMGSGTRIKILEAMAMGKPVVSTAVGCEGHAVTNGRDILIADRPAEFASCVLRLLRDRGLADSLARAGLDLVRRVYDYRTLAPSFDAVYRDAAGATAPITRTGSSGPPCHGHPAGPMRLV